MIGQYAENVYFGKPCGLMDQMASSVGNLVYIDFEDPSHPVFLYRGGGADSEPVLHDAPCVPYRKRGRGKAEKYPNPHRYRQLRAEPLPTRMVNLYLAASRRSQFRTGIALVVTRCFLPGIVSASKNDGSATCFVTGHNLLCTKNSKALTH